ERAARRRLPSCPTRRSSDLAAGASKEARTRSGRPTMNEGRGPLQLVASLFRRLAVLLAAVMVFGGAARAAEPVSVTAREYSLWDGRRLFLAEGDVTVRYGEAVITADFMTYDAEARYAVFEGSVVYVDDERELAGR